MKKKLNIYKYSLKIIFRLLITSENSNIPTETYFASKSNTKNVRDNINLEYLFQNNKIYSKKKFPKKPSLFSKKSGIFPGFTTLLIKNW